MAFVYSRLKDIAYIAGSAAAVVTNGAGAKTYIRCIVLHNTHTSGLATTLYNVPDSAGSVGTASAANQFYKETIAPDGIVILEFPTPGIVLSDTNDTLQAVCGTADKVTIQVHGGTE